MVVAASASATMTRPGMTMSHPACMMYARPASSRAPHSGEGGATPRPRNDRLDAHTIDCPTESAKIATSGRRALGRMCARTIRAGE